MNYCYTIDPINTLPNIILEVFILILLNCYPFSYIIICYLFLIIIDDDGDDTLDPKD